MILFLVFAKENQVSSIGEYNITYAAIFSSVFDVS